jgi:hypothetical protein
MTKKPMKALTCRPTKRLVDIRGRGSEIRFWSLQDEVFFERYRELSDDQIRFYLGLRKAWRRRGGTAVVVEKWTAKMDRQLNTEARDVQQLCDLGVILREDVRAMARRIRAQG